MIYIEKVQGEIEQAQPVVITEKTVFIHKNIKAYEPPLSEGGEGEEGGTPNDVDLYEYEEYQLTPEEYQAALDIKTAIKSKKDSISNYNGNLKEVLVELLKEG